MVRGSDLHKSSSFKFKKMLEIARNLSGSSAFELGMGSSSPLDGQRSGTSSPYNSGEIHPSTKPSMPRLIKDSADKDKLNPSDMDLMKKKFARLLLGEDMCGGAKGASSALALSNAMTNLGASVFGEQITLEPMKPETKARWRKEVEWLLSVTDHIVEFVPSQQQSPDGTIMEVMVTRQRADLLANLPELRKLDAILMDCLDKFGRQSEFWYVTTPDELDESMKNNNRRNRWTPVVKVPEAGLSDMLREWIQEQKDSVVKVLEASLAINSKILSAMEIPPSYIDALPKNGRATLGDLIYKSITDEYFDHEKLLGSMDLSSEDKVVELKNRIEASIVIWKRKMVQKDGKSSWGSAVSLEKRELFEERAETILHTLKQNFPGIPQSTLDISKIKCNKDVGHAILESYSRVIETLATSVMCRIEDVLHADSLVQSSTSKSNSEAPANSATLLDFMGWGLDQGLDHDVKKMKSNEVDGNKEEENMKLMIKTQQAPEAKRISYLERLENWGGVRSPTARH